MQHMPNNKRNPLTKSLECIRTSTTLVNRKIDQTFVLYFFQHGADHCCPISNNKSQLFLKACRLHFILPRISPSGYNTLLFCYRLDAVLHKVRFLIHHHVLG